MELKFTPFNIAKLEKANKGVPFGELIVDSTFSSIREFVKAGMNVDDDNLVDNAIQEYFDSGKTLNELSIEILNKLEDGHFLERGVAEVTKQEMGKQRVAIGELSENSGKKENPTQSQ